MGNYYAREHSEETPSRESVVSEVICRLLGRALTMRRRPTAAMEETARWKGSEKAAAAMEEVMWRQWRGAAAMEEVWQRWQWVLWTR